MPIQRSISSTGETLRNIILSVTPHLRNISPEASAVKPHPDKWSKKEIIGHMIDSASNNHQRFVRSQFQEDMVFAGYQQNDWVHVQAYQSRSWSELIELWAAYNLQLAHIISHTLDEIRFRPVSRHNLHQITFKRIPESENTCLEYFMVDYVAHLEHHVGQIFPDYSKQIESYENNFHS